MRSAMHVPRRAHPSQAHARFRRALAAGIDHAGISTQVVVERLLKREGTSRHDLGREAFIARVWQWKEQSGGRIAEQMRILGCSADWERSRFTPWTPTCPGRSRSVRAAVRGRPDIYRATRLVNWGRRVANRAVESRGVEIEENVQGELYEFAYPVLVADPSAGATELVIATTRPETMLGDTAVAVHPDDPRYKHLHGKKLRHPFLDRQVRSSPTAFWWTWPLVRVP
jgi:valyl-tRNA synthetase